MKPLVIPKLLIESFLKYSIDPIDLEMVNKRNPIWCERCDLSISILPVWYLSQTWELNWVICFFLDHLTEVWCLFYKNYFASSTVLFSNLVHRPNEAQCISFVSAPYLTPSPLSFLRSDRSPSLPRQQSWKVVAKVVWNCENWYVSDILRHSANIHTGHIGHSDTIGNLKSIGDSEKCLSKQ